MLSSRASWFKVLGVALVVAIVGIVGVYYFASNNSQIKADSGSGDIPSPVITSFMADPTTILSGQTSKLTWQTQYVDFCTLGDLPIDSVNGWTQVSPARTTNYVLKCANTALSKTVTAIAKVTIR